MSVKIWKKKLNDDIIVLKEDINATGPRYTITRQSKWCWKPPWCFFLFSFYKWLIIQIFTWSEYLSKWYWKPKIIFFGSTSDYGQAMRQSSCIGGSYPSDSICRQMVASCKDYTCSSTCQAVKKVDQSVKNIHTYIFGIFGLNKL